MLQGMQKCLSSHMLYSKWSCVCNCLACKVQSFMLQSSFRWFSGQKLALDCCMLSGTTSRHGALVSDICEKLQHGSNCCVRHWFSRSWPAPDSQKIGCYSHCLLCAAALLAEIKLGRQGLPADCQPVAISRCPNTVFMKMIRTTNLTWTQTPNLVTQLHALLVRHSVVSSYSGHVQPYFQPFGFLCNDHIYIHNDSAITFLGWPKT